MKVKLDRLIERYPEFAELIICEGLDPAKIAVA